MVAAAGRLPSKQTASDPVQPALDAMAAKRYSVALQAARATLVELKSSSSASSTSTDRRARLRARKIEAFALARLGDLKGAQATFAALAVEGAAMPEGTRRPAAPVGQPDRPALIEDALYQKAICTAALGDTAAAEAQFNDLMRRYPESPLMLAAMKRVARLHEGNIPKATEALWKRAMAQREQKTRAARRALALCGPLCLAELMQRTKAQGSASAKESSQEASLDRPLIEALAREMKTDETGTSLRALRDAARQHGFPDAQGVQLTSAGLRQQSLPLVALIAPGHFVLVESIDADGGVTLWYPPSSVRSARPENAAGDGGSGDKNESHQNLERQRQRGAIRKLTQAEWLRLWTAGDPRAGAMGTAAIRPATAMGYALTLRPLNRSDIKTARR